MGLVYVVNSGKQKEKPGAGLVVFLIAVLLIGCADRQRNNPLDPKNPKTGGKPSGVHVFSKEHQIFLSWDCIKLGDFVGMRIYRRSDGEESWTLAAFVNSDSCTFREEVPYGTGYSYALQAVTSTYESPLSDPVHIVPGPSYVWVASSGAGMIAELTHDASHLIAMRSDLIYPNGLAPAEYGRGVWLADYYTNEIIRIGPNLDILHRFLNANSPLDVDYDPERHRLWVALRGRNAVVLLDSTARTLAEATGFSYPASLSVDSKTGVCWVGDLFARKVVKLDAQILGASSTGKLVKPSSVAASRLDGTCWVADSSRVLQIGPNLEILKELKPFHYAARVAVDQVRGNVWVLDLAMNSTLRCFSGEGQARFSVDGFAAPRSLDVDEYDGSCLVADTWNYRIVKVDTAGEIIGEFNFSVPPQKVRVQTK